MSVFGHNWNEKNYQELIKKHIFFVLENMGKCKPQRFASNRGTVHNALVKAPT